MLANAITLFRVLLTFGFILLFGRHGSIDIALTLTILLIFLLDALDGYIARKRNETSELGSVLDIAADRLIENIFWIYFTATGQIPVWMPITVMTRGVITDALQGKQGTLINGWAHALTRSRLSRALYGASKMLTFMILASVTVFKNPNLEIASNILSTLTVGFCLLRGLCSFFIVRHSVKIAPSPTSSSSTLPSVIDGREISP